MSQAQEIRDVLKVQDELIQQRVVWDVEPCLELEMSTPQFKALLLISEEEGTRMRELARKMGGSFSNATVLVDRLVARGFVQRLAEPEDRRVVLVRVSEEGRRLIEKLVTSWRAISPSLLETLVPKDLEKVHDALRILRKAAQQDRKA